MSNITNELMDLLADAYDKRETSNNYKLLKLAATNYQKHEKTLDMVKAWRDIDQAEGTTLDLIGNSLGAYRMNKSDYDYRLMIKLQIRSNMSIGDVETINEIAYLLMGEAFLGIYEGRQYNAYHPSQQNSEAALMVVVKAGSDGLEDLPYTQIDRITAGGVRVSWELLNAKNITVKQLYEGKHAPQNPYLRPGQMASSLTTYNTGGLPI